VDKNMSSANQIPAVLTIAGSDSGGGAGLQADLKVFNALGCFGTTAVTCLTAQNPDEVRGVEAVSPEMVTQQVKAVCDSFPVVAVKTGMLFSAEIIAAVADVIKSCAIKNVVVDPVMVSTSAKRLLQEDAVEVLQRELLPIAGVITPNLPEAEVLCGHSIVSEDDLKTAAEEISLKFGAACALKGGHLEECGG
jgi:hydroxymethylpyrimidine/phosphomethylpyrimidine kinase